SNGAGVEKRADLHLEYAIVVEVLVEFPVGQKKAAAERRGPFAAVDGGGVAAEPKIVVAIEAELEKVVERRRARCSARAEARSYGKVVALGPRKPIGEERAAQPGKRAGAARSFREIAAAASLGGGLNGEARLRNAQQGTICAEPCRERSGVAEERFLHGPEGPGQILEVASGGFEPCAPAPIFIYERTEFSAGTEAAKIQIGEWWGSEGFREVPV